MGTSVRWSLKVSKETDLSLRSYLDAQGMKKGDFSKFVEEAVRWRIFDRTIQGIKTHNAGTDPDHLQDIIDEAVHEVRVELGAQKRAQ